MLVIYLNLDLNQSLFFEFNDLEFQLIDGLLLLHWHTKIADAVEEFAGLLLAF